MQYRLNDRVQLWPHWQMSLHVPEVEGYASWPALLSPACMIRLGIML